MGSATHFDRILKDARKGGGLGAEDVRFLLIQTDPVRVERLFAAARGLRREHFDDRVFLYGFVYFSTYCRNDCTFCQHRRSNSTVPRYRKPAADIMHASRRLAAEGVHLIDLTMGEDPRMFEDQPAGFDELAERVRRIKSETGLPVMISPGVLPRETLRRMALAGADWYACYQETHTPERFKALRPFQSYSERWQAKVDAAGVGLLVEEGILCGVGETMQDVVESIAKMEALGADQVRVMSLVPQQGTPFAGLPAPGPLRELLILAVMRLAFPDRLIPASLDVAGLAGVRPRLEAGANVITSCIAPASGYAGVAHAALDIDNAGRMPRNLLPVLAGLRLRPAAAGDYQAWLNRRREVHRIQRAGVQAPC
jgi:methylornithine synthase